MGRPKGGTNKNHSKEEKLALVLRNLNGETLRTIEGESVTTYTKLFQIQFITSITSDLYEN